MSFEFKEPPKVDGEWASMRELAKIGETLLVRTGFLVDDPDNTYRGDPSPRFIVVAKSESTGDDVKVGVGKGYSRDDKLSQLVAYLEENPDAEVGIQFVETDGAYIDVTTV